MEEFRKGKANRIWNRKTFYKLIKLFNLRIYITYNIRLRHRNKRDYIQGCTMQSKYRYKVWEQQGHMCARCMGGVEYKQCELHHILPLNKFKQFFDDTSNMQVLCHDCHKEIHCNPFLEASLIKERCGALGLKIEDYYGQNCSVD